VIAALNQAGVLAKLVGKSTGQCQDGQDIKQGLPKGAVCLNTMRMRLFTLFFTFFALAACATVPSLPAGQVRTSQGIVQGTNENGQIMSWRGIEYARAARWKLPDAGPSWEGVKQASDFGPACPQAGQAVMVEDCLFLNVYAPASATASSRLPVVVWFHGGGFRAGSGGAGPKEWTQDGMIVVTFNYRLSLLGFHDWLGWNEGQPRNFGQADMVAALKWVSANIGGFGGDPSNVTIFGHSAGGMAVQLMMTDPRAQDLFKRAIADAAYASWPFPQAANPSDEMRMRIRYGPLEETATPAELVARVPHFHLPYVGGADLPKAPLELLGSGPVSPVPMMTGFTSYDGGGTMAGAGFSIERLMSSFEQPDAIRGVYSDDFAVSEQQGTERVFGDRRYGLSARQSLTAVARRGQSAWGYYVTGPTGNRPGVAHGGYYEAFFAKDGSRNWALARAFSRFVRTGKPNLDDQAWPEYKDASKNWVVFDPNSQIAINPIAARLDMLEQASFAPE
jgi:para-nitrobenzyl esterase